MIDPFSGLGVASSILQVIDFTSKLLVAGYESYKSVDGLPAHSKHILDVASNLDSLCQSLRTQAQNSQQLSKNEARLNQLATKCQLLTDEVSEVLDKLQVKSQGALRGLETIRKTIKSLVKASDIKHLQKRLCELREQVNSTLLVIIRDNNSVFLQSLQDLEVSGIRLQVDTANVVRTTRDELLTVLYQQEEKTKHAFRNGLFNQTVSQKASDQNQFITQLLQKLEKLIIQGQETATSHSILQSLLFHQMQARREAVHNSYPDTFSWIFDDEVTPFKSWLASRDGTFWIRGKAGSGKSTLMKYLSGHEQTMRLLQTWAGDKKLVVAEFYFWSAGTPMQRSQVGLLQSLLFQLLRQCPHLIPTACPKRWHSEGLKGGFADSWTRDELLDAISSVISSSELTSRFCFFIDGLDEYSSKEDTDAHEALSLSLRKIIAKTDVVKLCISSRPWNPFVTAYGHEENRVLILENFTKNDIDCYVRGMLEGDENFQALIQREPSALDLVHEIRDRAQGVFLWVFLVVRSLLNGLSERDDVRTLRRRLYDLPGELHGFFRRILDSIDPTYRQLTSRMLILSLHAAPLPLMSFQYLQLEEDDPDYALKADFEPLEDPTGQLSEDAEYAVNKWCRDFLEINPRANGNNQITNLEINFLHRTVRDFLEEVDINKSLRDHAGASFEPYSTMCSIQLAIVKNMPLASNGKPEALELATTCDELMFWARAQEECTQMTALSTIRAFETVFDRLYDFQPFRRPPRSVMRLRYTNREHCRNRLWLTADTNASFFAYAVSYGLVQYVTFRLGDEPLLMNKSGQPLLDYALRPARLTEAQRRWSGPVQANLEMVQLLLKHGANPNATTNLNTDRADDLSVWHCYLGRLRVLQNEPQHWAIVVALVREGADIHSRVPIIKLYINEVPHPISSSNTGPLYQRTKTHTTVYEALRHIQSRDAIKQLLEDTKNGCRKGWLQRISDWTYLVPSSLLSDRYLRSSPAHTVLPLSRVQVIGSSPVPSNSSST